MVLRIVLDVVRRKWRPIAFAVFQISLLTKLAWQFWPGVDAWAAPLAGAWYLTLLPGPLLHGREFYQLPVSRRTWWLARWWMSTAVVTILVTLSLAAGHLQAGTPQESGERLALFMAFAFLYTGSAMVLVAGRVGRHLDQPIDIHPKLSPPGTFKNDPNVNVRWLVVKAVVRAAGGMLILTLLSLAAPFLFARFLPHRFADIGVGFIVVMVVLAGATLLGFRHHPAVLARPSGRALRRADPTASPSRPAPSAVTAKPAFADRLTGWRLALWDECRKQLIVFSSLMVILVIVWAVASVVRHVPPLPVFLSNADALPLASHRAHATEFVTWTFLYFFAGMFDAATPPRVRPLRTLPMSTNALSGLPLALGLISAAMLWIVLVALHLLVLHSAPVAPRIDLFVAFAALVTLSHVLRFVTPTQPVAKGLIGFAPFAVVVMAGGYFIETWHPEVVQPLMLAGGLVLLSVSFVLMRVSLAQNSRMYRPAAIVGRLQ